MSIFGPKSINNWHTTRDNLDIYKSLLILNRYRPTNSMLEMIKNNSPICAANQKPLITIWAEEKGTLESNKYQWSFGSGVSEKPNGGYPMMIPGRIIRMGLSADSDTPDIATVNVVVNGIENTLYSITIPPNRYSSTITFVTPLELHRGDRINFKTASTNTAITGAVVTLLIELDYVSL